MVQKRLNQIKLVNFVKVIGLAHNSTEIYASKGILVQEGIGDNFVEIDCSNCILSPGFIDVQVNGFGNCDFWTIAKKDSKEGFALIDDLRLKLAYCGVVSFCPTIITGPKEKIIQSIDYINSYIKQSKLETGARILGIHIEGIFITKYGVHESKYVQKDLSVKNIEPFVKDNVILFTLAPELDSTGEAIKFLQKNNILVSIGHTNASYKEGIYAINEHDLKTVTHMFNSLRGVEGFSHRGSGLKNIEMLKLKLENEKNIDPDKDGIMLALLKDKNVLTMVISDGIHVHKEVVKLLRMYKDVEKFSLVSDVVSLDFFNQAKSSGMLGGGQSTLDKCVFNLVNWDICNIESALISASKPIAKELKHARDLGLGEIAYGKEANIVLWDTKKNAVKGTIIGENVFLNY